MTATNKLRDALLELLEATETEKPSEKLARARANAEKVYKDSLTPSEKSLVISAAKELQDKLPEGESASMLLSMMPPIETYEEAAEALGSDFIAKTLAAYASKGTTSEVEQDFTVIASVAMEGTLKIYHVRATDPYHAFGVVAQEQQDIVNLEFLTALHGIHTEGETFTLPGEGIVCSETVLEQGDVFGIDNRDEDSARSASKPKG